MYEQEPPFAVQIESCEGCNLACPFCGENGIREHAGGPYKFMTPETCEVIALSIADSRWSSRIELAMHGEPTLNPHHVDLIRILREHLPDNQIMLTSNGSGLLRGNPVERITDLMEAGLNILALDDYKTVNIVPRIRQRRAEIPYPVYDYPGDGLDYSPHRRRSITTHAVIIIQDISEATAGSHADLNNHCGLGAPLDYSMKNARCAKPFRELSIRWDGNIAICCNDWSGQYRIGNVLDAPIDEIWQSQRFTAARRKLLHHQRDFGPCLGCNAKSYRTGLLPDKKGKETLPSPDEECRRIIQEAMILGPYTPAVPRPWDKPDYVRIKPATKNTLFDTK